MESFRCGDKLIFHIVVAMNDSDDPGRVVFGRNVYAEQIYIEFFPVTAQYMRYMSVMNRIGKAGVFGVYASNRSVYFYRNGFSEIGFYKCFSQRVDDKLVFPLAVCFPAVINGSLQGKGYLESFILFCSGGRVVEIFPEVYVVYPIHTICKDDVDEMGLQISRTFIMAARCK